MMSQINQMAVHSNDTYGTGNYIEPVIELLWEAAIIVDDMTAMEIVKIETSRPIQPEPSTIFNASAVMNNGSIAAAPASSAGKCIIYNSRSI